MTSSPIPAQAPAAGRAGAGTGVDHALARQVRRQVPPGGLEPSGLPRLGDDRRAARRSASSTTSASMASSSCSRRVPSFSTRCRTAPASSGELAAQLLDQGAGVDRLARQADDQTLEGVDVVGQRGSIESHANSLALARGRRHRP